MRHILLTLLFSGGLLAAPAQEPRSERYRFPVRNVAGLYSANFGEMRPNHFHSGVDIKTDGVTGKPVVAAADGYVVRIAVSPGGYGRALYIAHPDGTTTVYGHLERFRTDIESYLRYKRYEQGRSNVDFTCKPSLFPVRAGDTVALSGNSGMSFGPHLHFEVRRSSDQRTLNTLAAKLLPVRDRIAPRIMRLHYVEVDSLGDVPVHSRPRTFDVVRRSEGDYALRQTQPVAVGRRGYFIVECSDRKDEVYNTFGIYRLTEEVDGEVRYEYRMDGFLFGDTRYCNAVSYYPMQLSSRNEVIRLTQPAGCPDRFFTTMKNRALLTTPAGRRQEVRITAEDDCGNRSVLAFTVEGKADERSFRAPACDSLPVVRHDRDFHREGDGVRIEIPAGTLYESCFYTQRPHDEPQPKDSTLLFLSRGVEILDVRLPMHRYATLWIDAGSARAAPSRSAGLAFAQGETALRRRQMERRTHPPAHPLAGNLFRRGRHRAPHDPPPLHGTRPERTAQRHVLRQPQLLGRRFRQLPRRRPHGHSGRKPREGHLHPLLRRRALRPQPRAYAAPHGHRRRGQHPRVGGNVLPVKPRSIRTRNTPAAAVAAGVISVRTGRRETAPIRYELKMLRRMMPVAPWLRAV